ncbi:MAG: lipoprotein [Gammaproteobacteria bacterium]|nr:lipoprotein [Gammaproteobacteria bacterium]MCK5091955.1 lipoprotein [Gammaproteobacteria bacterium]
MPIVTMLMVACGQKGPLYLPEPSGQQEKQYESQQEKQNKNKDKQGNEN